MTNFRDYYPDNFLDNLTSFFNDKTAAHVVENKLFFDLYFKQFEIRIPKTVMYNHSTFFVSGNESFQIKNSSELGERLRTIFRENPAYDSIIIKKTYGSYGGHQIYKLSKNQCGKDEKILNEIYDEIINTGYLFQETIVQHPDLDKVNPSCINTIRMDAFIDSNGKVEIISAFLRININNSHLDNISQGGYGIGINLSTGKLKKYGYCQPSFSIYPISSHPSTGTVFEDFQLPYFNEVKKLVLKAAGLMPRLRLVGWDVAISKTGPVLMEGNSGYGAGANDLLDGGYKSNSIYQKVLNEYYLLTKI